MKVTKLFIKPQHGVPQHTESGSQSIISSKQGTFASLV